MCAMDGGLTASILSTFLLLFLQRLESKQFSASLAARVLDVNWVLPSGVLVNI